MRILMEVKLPREPFNSYVKDGSVGVRMQKILADAKPEAAYFGDRDGKRGGIIVVNMDNASQVPALAEPWFLGFNAHVEFSVVMTPEDLGRAGLEAPARSGAEGLSDSRLPLTDRLDQQHRANAH
jgi:hypothetical protein